MLSREEVIEIARGGESNLSRVDDLIASARLALENDQNLHVAICLDGLRSIVGKSKGVEVQRVVRFLGDLLDDPRLFRMRKRILVTIAWTYAPWAPIFEQMERTKARPRAQSVRRIRRELLVRGAWESLESEDAAIRQRGIELYDRLGPVGLFNLNSFLFKNPASPGRPEIQSRIAAMESRIPSACRWEFPPRWEEE